MFTGLVEKAEVLKVDKSGDEMRLRLRPLFDWEKPVPGESVAVCGACLSVEVWHGGNFTVYASRETLSCTNLPALRPGDSVNIERALALGDRLGGHLVSGHVDDVATVEYVRPVGESHCIKLSFDPQWSRHVIPKGSIALDGVSLTVNVCGPGYVEVNVIPETWSATTVGLWQAGRRVNLETDVMGKYAAHLLGAYSVQEKNASSSSLTFEFLRDNGF